MFNPDKCELIRITNTKLHIVYDYNILKNKIIVVSSVKYLGVYVRILMSSGYGKSMLSISSAKPTHWELSFKEILPLAPEQSKDACYKIMVCLIIEHAALIWSPYTQSLINNLEAVHREAARFVCNKYCR